ncbi:MAG: hypothetical protein JWQ90_3863 [Hydrocarboniphaga sp.]|uniref:NAD-dependent epimerase/dehydratase family protein n=1 Tax=Hydrocarboniphaga sp. TaxID=2033016 RepID=UPI00263699C1|nr:NAD-dependent epimerase/dehydratase family protein [Hydrocarboniphaga sp.]MDB5971413.1 hypothetical protein [Hydrocarboniphaga sp.]
MSTGTILVVGASGFVGAAAVRRLVADGRRVLGVARHAPSIPVAGAEYLQLDLLDAVACAAAAAKLADVTRVVYAAVNETPGSLVASWTDPDYIVRNGRMFANLLDALLPQAHGLRHICVIHGTKAYAVHRGDEFRKVPLRESLPRPDNDDFYFRQEDELRRRAQGQAWSWTVLRAPVIAGGGRDSNLNSVLVIAIFAAIHKALGIALPFPGARDQQGVVEMVDVDLLAKAIAWSGGAPSAHNQIFNVTNGDVFSWRDLWPILADAFGVTVGESQEISLQRFVDDHADTWAQLVERHGLTAPRDPRRLLGESCALADFMLYSSGRCSVLTSTIKIRQAGFHECIDTATSLLGWIQRWRDDGLLPPR